MRWPWSRKAPENGSLFAGPDGPTQVLSDPGAPVLLTRIALLSTPVDSTFTAKMAEMGIEVRVSEYVPRGKVYVVPRYGGDLDAVSLAPFSATASVDLDTLLDLHANPPDEG